MKLYFEFSERVGIWTIWRGKIKLGIIRRDHNVWNQGKYVLFILLGRFNSITENQWNEIDEKKNLLNA